MSGFCSERLYGAPFSCDIDYVSNSEEKLAGVDQALAELGKGDAEISEVRDRFARGEAWDLKEVDDQLSALSDGVNVVVPSLDADVHVDSADWDDEATEVEIIDESDFELLVDEDDLDELEKVGEDDAVKVVPPEMPQEGDEEGDGFFKKLFGGRRSRPPQQ